MVRNGQVAAEPAYFGRKILEQVPKKELLGYRNALLDYRNALYDITKGYASLDEKLSVWTPEGKLILVDEVLKKLSKKELKILKYVEKAADGCVEDRWLYYHSKGKLRMESGEIEETTRLLEQIGMVSIGKYKEHIGGPAAIAWDAKKFVYITNEGRAALEETNKKE
jgi:hypothetical protein